MRITAISDLHGFLPVIPETDILLVGGDVVPDSFSDATKAWTHEEQEKWCRNEFSWWLEKVPAKVVVGIAGNHDFVFAKSDVGYKLPWIYLKDESAHVLGLTVHGSPMTPEFGGWAFMTHEGTLNHYWDEIPGDVDILITHGPPYGYGDATEMYLSPGQDPHVGSRTLRNKLDYTKYSQLKLHVFGHIHEGYGEGTYNDDQTIWANVSHVDEYYEPTRIPMTWGELDGTGTF